MKRKQLILKQLRILSIPEKSAKLVTFHPQKNLITGENDVGKSSIIKSIYHTLGADVHFDNVWIKCKRPAEPHSQD
jgi:predicted GTPase